MTAFDELGTWARVFYENDAQNKGRMILLRARAFVCSRMGTWTKPQPYSLESMYDVCCYSYNLNVNVFFYVIIYCGVDSGHLLMHTVMLFIAVVAYSKGDSKCFLIKLTERKSASEEEQDPENIFV